MINLFRISLKQILLLFALIAALLAIIIVPRYRRYADHEYLMKHPAIKCNSYTSNIDVGAYSYLGIEKVYEEIDDIEIHLKDLHQASELGQLLAAIDRSPSIRTLWFHAEGEHKAINLSDYFQQHEFDEVGFVNCSLNSNELPGGVKQAKKIVFYFCLFSMNEKPFHCQGYLHFSHCSITGNSQDVAISADSMAISFDQVDCESLTVELRGREKSSLMMTKKTERLKNFRILGATEWIEFDGMDEKGDASEIVLDISELSYRKALVRKVQTVKYKKKLDQEFYPDEIGKVLEVN